MPEHAVLPNVRMTLSLEDIYQVFSAGVAYGARSSASSAPPQLASLLLTLRGRYFDDHLETWLGALDDAPDWLAAQQTLKERQMGDATNLDPPRDVDELPGWLLSLSQQADTIEPPLVEGWPV